MRKVEQHAGVTVGMRRLFGNGTLVHDSERQLLDRFRGQGDEQAFEAIIARHGPMVAGVCRSMLTDPADADDAFQATFLVLVRRAGTIRDGDRLSPWLHGVARRVSLRAKARVVKRRGREGTNPEAMGMVAAPPELDAADRELHAAVHVAVGRLPALEQLAITLCHLEGLTHQEAADRLGWPLGTVKTRVNRGRDRLRGQLARRGVAATDAGVGAVLTTRSAFVARSLARATVQNALAATVGRGVAAGSIPAIILELAHRAGRGPVFTPAKILAGCLAVTVSAATAAGVVAFRPSEAPKPPPRTAQGAIPALPVVSGSVQFDRVVIDAAFPGADQVEVADVDGDGKPDLVVVGGTTIAWYQNPTWTKRVIASGGDPLKGNLIGSATVDLDGDGRAEIAIACDFARDTPARGQLFLASPGQTLDAPWTFGKVADVPSIHRVRWGDLDGDKKPELVVAPLFGPNSQPPTYDQDPARVVELHPDPQNPKTGKWAERLIARRPVVQSVEVTPFGAVLPWGKLPVTVTTADSTGLSLVQLVPNKNKQLVWWESTPWKLVVGATDPAPHSGCSVFRQATDQGGMPFFVTIDLRRRSEVTLWERPPSRPQSTSAAEETARLVVAEFKALGERVAGRRLVKLSRTVLDGTLDAAHVLWTTDVDGDRGDEIFVGSRGPDHRVVMYQQGSKGWDRTVLDNQIEPQDLRGGDLDGDGVPDLVAVGGTTHNVVWYHPTRLKPELAAKPR